MFVLYFCLNFFVCFISSLDHHMCSMCYLIRRYIVRLFWTSCFKNRWCRIFFSSGILFIIVTGKSNDCWNASHFDWCDWDCWNSSKVYRAVDYSLNNDPYVCLHNQKFSEVYLCLLVHFCDVSACDFFIIKQQLINHRSVSKKITSTTNACLYVILQQFNKALVKMVICIF